MLHKYPVLFVSWRSPASRRIHPVGRLTHEAETHGYEFRYIRAVEEATADGFTPLPEFPKLDAVYRSTRLFPLFANRVMPASRPGYGSFLSALGLSEETAEPMAILARTGGERQTDQIELFPRPQGDGSGCYVARFLLRAVKYMPQPATEERIARLAVGEPLRMMPDPQNPVDPSAVAVRTDDNFILGYLPRYLTADVGALSATCPKSEVFVDRVNLPPAEAHHRLLCKVVSCWPDGFRPFDTDEFQPLTGLPVGAV